MTIHHHLMTSQQNDFKILSHAPSVCRVENFSGSELHSFLSHMTR